MKLSVIIPAHNEEKRIVRTLKDVDGYLEKQDYNYEIIIVDNNSTDRTVEVVEKLFSTSVQKGRIIQEKTPGKGAAVKRGMDEAVGDFVLFMDADNATPVSEIEKFWKHFDEGASVVIGSRYLEDSMVVRKQPWYRIMLSRMSNLLIQIVVLRGIHDTQLGFKAFTNDAARSIFKHVTTLGWAFDMEVLTIARVQDFTIKEASVLWREYGGSHVPGRAYIQSLLDLFRIKIKSLGGYYDATAPAGESDKVRL